MMTIYESDKLNNALAKTVFLENAIRDMLNDESIDTVCKKYNINKKELTNYINTDIISYLPAKPYPTDEEQLKRLTVYDLNLCCSYKYLVTHNILTVKDLLNLSYEDIKDLSTDTMKEISHTIHSLGLRLSDDIEEHNWLYDPEFDKVLKDRRMYELWCLDDDKKLALSIDEIGLSIRAYNCLKRAGIYTVNDIIETDVTGLMVVRNLGNKSLKEVITTIYKLGLSFKDGHGSYMR